MNWFAITIICIWICCTISSIFLKTCDPFLAAIFVSLMGGIGYMLYQMKMHGG